MKPSPIVLTCICVDIIHLYTSPNNMQSHLLSTVAAKASPKSVEEVACLSCGMGSLFKICSGLPCG